MYDSVSYPCGEMGVASPAPEALPSACFAWLGSPSPGPSPGAAYVLLCQCCRGAWSRSRTVEQHWCCRMWRRYRVSGLQEIPIDSKLCHSRGEILPVPLCIISLCIKQRQWFFSCLIKLMPMGRDWLFLGVPPHPSMHNSLFGVGVLMPGLSNPPRVLEPWLNRSMAEGMVWLPPSFSMHSRPCDSSLSSPALQKLSLPVLHLQPWEDGYSHAAAGMDN